MRHKWGRSAHPSSPKVRFPSRTCQGPTNQIIPSRPRSIFTFLLFFISFPAGFLGCPTPQFFSDPVKQTRCFFSFFFFFSLEAQIRPSPLPPRLGRWGGGGDLIPLSLLDLAHSFVRVNIGSACLRIQKGIERRRPAKPSLALPTRFTIVEFTYLLLHPLLSTSPYPISGIFTILQVGKNLVLTFSSCRWHIHTRPRVGRPTM